MQRLYLLGSCGLLVVVAVLALVWVIVVYNRLLRQRNQAQTSWAQIDVQLVRRHELIPNLVETVRGYAAHEQATLAAVTAARTGAMAANAAGPTSRGQAEGVLANEVGRVFALAEGYPQLRADQNFAQLQAELTATEDRLAYARQFYNLAVQGLTNTIQSFPSNLVASLFGFRPPEYFQADQAAAGGHPGVTY